MKVYSLHPSEIPDRQPRRLLLWSKEGDCQHRFETDATDQQVLEWLEKTCARSHKIQEQES